MLLPERVLATYPSAGRPPSASCFGRHIWSPQYGQVWKAVRRQVSTGRQKSPLLTHQPSEDPGTGLATTN